MNVSLTWLRDYVDFALDAREMAQKLTETLTETELVESPAADVTDVVAARVVTVDGHPNADRLSVCVVDWGKGSSTVVCGAPNVRSGMVSALALPGAVIAGGRTVGAATIRGVASSGMLASLEELGLEEHSEGILELDDNVVLGTDIREVLGVGEPVLEVDVQPNRPDCMGVLGIAREVAAALAADLRTPSFELAESGQGAELDATVTVEDAVGCPRYVGRVIRDVTIGPSPRWLVERLQSVGVRSINNVVDITNFVMLEYGHPIHAFDLDRLESRAIVVRRARAGEVLTTLDDEERKLDTEHLLICDGEVPVALAGIMGGENSEVVDETKNILLECAWFDPAVVRRGARRLGMRTEASQRFERGIDPAAMDDVTDRACALLAELAGGTVAPGRVEDGPGKYERRTITVPVDRVRAMLSSSRGEPLVTVETVAGALRRLGYEVVGTPTEHEAEIAIPSFRRDVSEVADLIEDVARMLGYGLIVAEVPYHSLTPSPDIAATMRDAACEAMVGLGMTEIVTTSFVGERDESRTRAAGAGAAVAPVVLTNPVNKEMPLMRTSLMPGILDVVRHNVNVGEKAVRVFELGKIFWNEGGECRERWSLGAAVWGLAEPPVWGRDPREVDFYDLAGTIEGLGEALKVDSLKADCYDVKMMDESASARILRAGEPVGVAGKLSSETAGAWQLPEGVYALELDADALNKGARLIGKYEELPRFPASRRDIALILDEGVPAGDVVGEIEAQGEELLQGVGVFDVYSGGQLAPGTRSLGIALTYMSRERTLTDTEVDAAHAKIVSHVLTRFSASLRT